MLHERLKTETATQHRDAERGLKFDQSMSSKEGYLKLLQAFYGFYVPIEDQLSRYEMDFADFGIHLKERMKKNLLVNDMKSLGFGNVSSLPLDTSVKINNFHDAVGVFYVLEGSTMGGQIIAKRLKENGIITHEPCFHFPYGQKTMPMWMAFKEVLIKMDGKNDDATVAAAKNTFDALGKWFQAHV